jgi:hypothetical protein
MLLKWHKGVLHTYEKAVIPPEQQFESEPTMSTVTTL